MAELLTSQDLAQRWGLHPRTLANWRVARKGPAWTKIGWSVFYRLEDVVAYEVAQRREVSA